MHWNFENNQTDLDSLNSEVREKAIEIGNLLMQKGELTEKEALAEAIKRAKEWFYDLEG